MDIRVKRVYEPASPSDGKRVLVERLWPRGMKREDLKIDSWEKEVAPSSELRMWFAHDPTKWEEFKLKYWEELKGNPKIEELREWARRGTLTLLFSAKDRERNSAQALKEYLETG
ncbi:MAG TPA: DUF488 family protein [Thermoprotei archaeon]|nr:DUF488 family protein [TACK group archaeon]HEV51669.1 DUF488 family protein [Thermoprotei archaeon]